MVTYTYLMKNLNDTEWTDITSAVIDDKPSLRIGYSSIDSTLDMGSLTVQMRMADLTNASLLHTTKKQLQLKENGFVVFEGISADDASIDLGKTTDLVYAKLKFKAYSSLFSDAKASSEIVWHDVKVNDPGDAPNSLLHKLFGEIKATSPLLASLSILSGGAVSQKIIPLVIIEEGESLEGVLTEFLRQNGLAYYMNVNIVNVVRPYDVGRIPSQTIAIEDIIEKPSINQAPYVEEEPIVVKFGKIISKANEQVYELNANRNDDGSMLEHDEIPDGEYYPVDSDDEPSILQADYQTRFETDDIRLIYSTNQVMTITAKKGLGGTIVDATLTKVKADLKATGAEIQLRNDEGELVSLYNLVIKANAFYRDFSERYGDKDGEEIDGIYLADADSAKDLWRVIRAEQKAEKTRVRFTSHIEIEPNTLVTLTGLPYSLLVRYRTRKLDAWRLFEYECVAYQLTADLPQGAIKIASDTRPQDGVSYRTKVQFALGTAEAPLGDWQETPPTPAAGEYVWRREGTYLPPSEPTDWVVTRLTGDKGDPAPNLKVQYSVNGTSSWHPVFATGDKYMRTSNDNGVTYSTAMKIVGEDGSDGLDGEDGSYTIFEFSKGTATTAGTTWQDSPFIIGTDEYNWMRKGTVVPPATTVSSWSTPVRVTGDKGETGDIGRGIASITYTYATSQTQTGVKSAYSSSMFTLSATNKYGWQKEVISYTDGSTPKTTEAIIAVYGDKGADGNGIASIAYAYATSQSFTGAKSAYSPSMFTLSATNKFGWQREVISFTNRTKKTTEANIAVYGDKGDIGQGIDSITEQYAISTSKTTPPAEGSTDWKDVAPTWSTGKYLWTRSKIVYKNPADTKYTTPVCDTSWEAVNEVKDELNTIENHYGYKYFTDITVYGDSDKLYPVIIKGGNQGTKRDIFVRRGYSELAPPDWYTSTHKGDLVVKIKCNFGGWGGANYSWEIHELEEMYSRTFAGCQNVMSNMAFAIFLRGGGTTGARYHLYSNQSLTTPKYGGASPQICYNNELLGETGQYSWNAPDPKTFKTLKPDRLQDSDQQAIDVRNFIPLSKKSVKTSDVEYYLSTSSTTLSGGSWLTTAPQWVDGKFMWTRTKTTLNDGTVSYSPSSGGTCIAGAKGATGEKGDKGEDYRSIEIASIGDTLYYTSRGTLKTPSIEIVIKTNVEGVPILTASEGAIAEDEGQYIFVAAGVSYSENPVIITAELGDYQASLTINKIRDGQPVPENFKGISDVGDIPTTFGADPLINGDYFLWVDEDTAYPLAPDGVVKTGEVYEYQNGTWKVSTNQQLYMNLLPEFIDVANSSDSEVIGNAIIKKLATIEAFIHELTTNELTLSQNGSIASSYNDNGEMKRYQKGMIDDDTLPEDFGGFLLEADGYMELVRVRARDGAYSGELESTDTEGTLLHTQKYELGRPLPVSPKTYYLASDIIPHFPDKASKEVSINEGSYVHAFKPTIVDGKPNFGTYGTINNSRSIFVNNAKSSVDVILKNSYMSNISKVEKIVNGGSPVSVPISGSKAVISVSQGEDVEIRQSYNNPNAFVGLGQTIRNWWGMTTLGNDVYACVYNGDIYKQTNGTGDFVSLGQTPRRWYGMTTLGNDVYACVYNGDIYKQANGTGNFVALGQVSRYWYGMTTLGNDVYACVYNGDIYKQTNGTGNFVALGQTPMLWRGMTTLGNDIYACEDEGDIYKQTNGTGDFVALGQETRKWRGMTTLGNDVYACVRDGDIYKQTNGTGDFVSLGQTPRRWYGMTTLGNDIYASVNYNGDIYKQSYNPAHQSTISIALPNTEPLVLACTNTPTSNGTYDDFNGEVITFDTANDQSEKSVVIKNGGTTIFDSALNLYRTFKTVYDELEGIGTYALDDLQSTFNGTQAGYVVKSQNQLTFLTLAKTVIATIGSTTYTKTDAILYLLGQTRGVKTATLLPETGASVGTAQNPYNEGHFENISGSEGYFENIVVNNMAEIMGFAPRNLMDVFGTSTVAETFAELRARAETGDFSTLRLGDYIDLPSLTIGADSVKPTVYPARTINNDYNRLRVEIVGFDDYLNVGNTAIPTQHHVTMMFKDIPTTAPFNETNVTTGDYPGSMLYHWLHERFEPALISAIGLTPRPVGRRIGTVSDWGWVGSETIFLPTNVNVFGTTGFSHTNYGTGTQTQFALFAMNPSKKIKKNNGSRSYWWLAEPSASSSTYFCIAFDDGRASDTFASRTRGVVPAFLI